MTVNVAELRQHLAWFDEQRDAWAVDEFGQRFEIIEVGETNGGDPRLVVRRVKA